MPGLILKLSPHERFVANGVVIENGDRRARLNILTPDSNVLRLRDAIHPEQANTPVSRVCYIIQLALAGEVEGNAAQIQALSGIKQLGAVFTDEQSIERLQRAQEDVYAARFYPALRNLRALLPAEGHLMALAELS
ncbi:MAG: flagellar biosynthesis repressor FlbT [Pikeienuella sp.]